MRVVPVVFWRQKKIPLREGTLTNTLKQKKEKTKLDKHNTKEIQKY